MKTKRPAFDTKSFRAKVGKGRTITAYRQNQPIFAQGDAADSLFYHQKGKVKLTVVMRHGKEAIVAVLGPTDFLPRRCLAGSPARTAPSQLTAANPCSLAPVK